MTGREFSFVWNSSLFTQSSHNLWNILLSFWTKFAKCLKQIIKFFFALKPFTLFHSCTFYLINKPMVNFFYASIFFGVNILQVFNKSKLWEVLTMKVAEVSTEINLLIRLNLQLYFFVYFLPSGFFMFTCCVSNWNNCCKRKKLKIKRIWIYVILKSSLKIIIWHVTWKSVSFELIL